MEIKTKNNNSALKNMLNEGGEILKTLLWQLCRSVFYYLTCMGVPFAILCLCYFADTEPVTLGDFFSIANFDSFVIGSPLGIIIYFFFGGFALFFLFLGIMQTIDEHSSMFD